VLAQSDPRPHARYDKSSSALVRHNCTIALTIDPSKASDVRSS
jgi:hypothetical protein